MSKYELNVPVVVTDHEGGKVEVMAMKPRGVLAVHGRLRTDGAYDNIFTISHLPTGLSVIPWINGKRTARMLLAVLAALPIRWEGTAEEIQRDHMRGEWQHKLVNALRQEYGE